MFLNIVLSVYLFQIDGKSIAVLIILVDSFIYFGKVSTASKVKFIDV